jgi:hypothetical protein
MEEIKTNMITYYKTNNPVIEIKVNIYYSIGGMNFFQGINEKRGYYLSATPVERTDCSVKFTAFTGVKKLLNEVKRKSKKEERIAIEKAFVQVDELVNYVAKKNGLSLVEDVLFA